MKSGSLQGFVQRLANRFGYHIRRVEDSVSFEDAYTEQIRLLGPDTRTVFEVGAADGRDSERYCNTFANAIIHAFEPGPESFAKIVERSKAHPRLKPHNVAVSDKAGHATFNIGDWPDTSSLLPAQFSGKSYDKYLKSSRSVDVETITLDMFCADHNIDRIDLLKMDVQGAEKMVFDGALGLLKAKAFRVILTEMPFSSLYEGSALANEIITLLYAHGYKIHNFYDMHYGRGGDIVQCDAIFVPA